MQLILYKLILLTYCLMFGQGARYEFVLDNDEIFDNCPEIPGNKGINDLADFSQYKFEYIEGGMKNSGNTTLIWEGVQPTDRIEGRAEILKFQRGSWQPTLFSASVADFCSKQFDKSSIWYQVWTSYIPEDEQLCINNVGHTYHHQPFEANRIFEFTSNVEGRHKLVVHLNAYDLYNVKRPKSICFQIFGEFIKVK